MKLTAWGSHTERTRRRRFTDAVIWRRWAAELLSATDLDTFDQCLIGTIVSDVVRQLISDGEQQIVFTPAPGGLYIHLTMPGLKITSLCTAESPSNAVPRILQELQHSASKEPARPHQVAVC